MGDFLFSLIVTTVAVMLAASIMRSVYVRSWGTAIVIALLIGILNPTIGWLLNVVFNIATLGIFWLLGLGFIIRWFVTAIIIKIVDAFLTGFKVKSFGTALVLSLIIAIVGTIMQWLI